MPEKYSLRDEPGKSIIIFEKHGKVYGHMVKDRDSKGPAKFIFETSKYDSVELLKADYPEVEKA